MSVEKYIEKMKMIQKSLLEFLDIEDNLEENIQNLQYLFNEQEIHKNKHELKSVLYLLLKICNNHHRGPNFFNKIERILQLFKEDFTNYFTNIEIFDIFKRNKRILLFLNEEKIMTIDEYIANKILTIDKYKQMKYPQYFLPEIQKFDKIKEEGEDNNDHLFLQELPENFYEYRKVGENSEDICQLIRNDSIKEFIVYINKNGISLNKTINQSIYETNTFLLKRKSSLIEYAIFYGSIQIFNYLLSNDIQLNSSAWIYAIHGQNSEIIHHLEDNHIEPADKTYKECLKESIKCHHNDITNYFLNNANKKIPKKQIILNQGVKYYNFAFIQNESIKQSLFTKLCEYDYYILVNILLKEKKINVNKIDVINDVLNWHL